jgi:hypothetical protein
MSAPRFFVNPFGIPSIPPHFTSVVPIINPTGPPSIIAFGHNGNTPFSHQVQFGSSFPTITHTHNRHSDYDYVGVLVVTKNVHTGMFEILLPVNQGAIELDFRRVRFGDDPHLLSHRILEDYGIGHYGKHTQIRHVEHSNGDKYKLCIVYAHEISRTRINSHRLCRHHCSTLHRFFLPKHKVGSSMKDNYGNFKSVDFITSNIIYAVGNMLSSIIY